MGYLHDWQPQRLSGIPGTRFYDRAHADANGHNHFGFLKPEMAREAVEYLRRQGIQVTEWSGDGGRVGGHADPGHYDGRSFDVPASQWSPTPNRDKEIAGMRKVEELMDGFLSGKGVPRAALPFLRDNAPRYEDGVAPPAPVLPEPERYASTTEEVVDRQAVESWQSAASSAGRNTDPGSAGYWERQDMKAWAAAHPQLAAAAQARHGFTLPKPEDRGALNGVRVGGLPPTGGQR